MLVDNLGPWFGGFQWRDLGAFPISDGEKNPQDPGYSQFNADVGYRVNEHLKLQATVFNLDQRQGQRRSLFPLTAGRLPGEPIDGGWQTSRTTRWSSLSGTLKVTWVF